MIAVSIFFKPKQVSHVYPMSQGEVSSERMLSI
jgi:hypothetical protein